MGKMDRGPRPLCIYIVVVHLFRPLQGPEPSSCRTSDPEDEAASCIEERLKDRHPLHAEHQRSDSLTGLFVMIVSSLDRSPVHDPSEPYFMAVRLLSTLFLCGR